ncbi:hypothetical protein ACQ4M3_28575 [Leptolyngbya sp. AN03gr2]|uniref:slr1601 family putative cell division protein n=1 Tax=unclassified Leptolyngbya TaxID=2650499 RepID=UPI003D31A20B
MNALPLPQPPESPKSRRSRSSKSSRRSHQQQDRVLAAEAIAKLSVNVVISGAAIAALVQLIPYSLNQQAKLKEIQAEVQTADTRVSRLKTDFNRYFDPQQANAIVQEQTNRADPNQRLVVLGNTDSPVQVTQPTTAQSP